jgi:alpha-tubulin suppressor-like RCC1 family protein
VWRVIAAGFSGTCGIQLDDSLWCWGSNTSGELGIGTAWSTVPVPVLVP